jgi:hypothetical protein
MNYRIVSSRSAKLTFPEIEPPEWEVDDRGVFFLNEIILGEPSEVQDNVLR